MIKKINDAIEARRKALQNDENEKGFTLIELMVVIIIIGILAAIAIPAFLNQRQAAWDATAKSDLANFEIAAAAYSTAQNGSYTGLSYGALTTSPYNFTPSSDDPAADWSTPTVTSTGYTVQVFNQNFGSTAALAHGHVWTFNSATGLTTHDS